jgi:hypothetical protein
MIPASKTQQHITTFMRPVASLLHPDVYILEPANQDEINTPGIMNAANNQALQSNRRRRINDDDDDDQPLAQAPAETLQLSNHAINGESHNK